MSLVIAVMGFAGTMTLSAIKRDRGVEDYGTLVRGQVSGSTVTRHCPGGTPTNR